MMSAHSMYTQITGWVNLVWYFVLSDVGLPTCVTSLLFLSMVYIQWLQSVHSNVSCVSINGTYIQLLQIVHRAHSMYTQITLCTGWVNLVWYDVLSDRWRTSNLHHIFYCCTFSTNDSTLETTWCFNSICVQCWNPQLVGYMCTTKTILRG